MIIARIQFSTVPPILAARLRTRSPAQPRASAITHYSLVISH